MKKNICLIILLLSLISCNSVNKNSNSISNNYFSSDSSIKKPSINSSSNNIISSSSSEIIEDTFLSASTSLIVNPLEYLFIDVKNTSYIDLPIKINQQEINWVNNDNKVLIKNNKLTLKQNGISIISAHVNGHKKDFQITISENKIIQTTQNGIPIHYKFLTKNYKIGPNMTPDKIILHNTANNASAKNEVNYLHSAANTTSTSYHFAVDENSIYQAIPLSKSAYHAGNININKSSIGIEVARSTSKDINVKNKAINNAIVLINLLNQEYNLDENDLMTHKDASGKHCPHDIYDRYGLDKIIKKIK